VLVFPRGLVGTVDALRRRRAEAGS
jgi:hypothetical protein